MFSSLVNDIRYYKYEIRPSAPPNASYSVFPQNFRMVSGTTSKRTFMGTWPTPQMAVWGPKDIEQSSLAEKALGFNCLHYYMGNDEASFAYPYLRNKSFVDATCTDGLRAEILFPSCWDGVNLDSEDHKAHVAFPTELQGGYCPDTHPVYLPILFYETIWNTQQFNTISGQFIFANGDPTGYGYHADFMAAWPEGFQEQVQANTACTSSESTGQVENCPLFKLQSQEEANKCRLSLPSVIEDEKTSGILPALPGTNPITGVQHAPDEPIDKSVTKVTSQQPMDSTSSGVPITTTSPAITSLPTMSSKLGDSFSTTTTTYTTSGYIVEMVLVEDIETVTVTLPYVASASTMMNGTNSAASSKHSYLLNTRHAQRHIRDPRRGKRNMHDHYHS